MRRLLCLLAVAVSGVLIMAASASASGGDGVVGGGGVFGLSAPAGAQTPGGAAGTFYWFDLSNTSTTTLSWPTDYQLSADMGYYIYGTFTASLNLAADVGTSSANKSVFWENTCWGEGGAKTVTISGATSGPGCKLTSSYDATINAQIHTASPGGTGANMGHIVAWNIKIWRSGKITPTPPDGTNTYSKSHTTSGTLIWSRQVGINGKSDSTGMTNATWWQGGYTDGNHYATSAAQLAGPIGVMDGPNSQQACIDRYNAAQKRAAHILATNPKAKYVDAATLDPGVKLDPGTGCYWDISLNNGVPTQQQSLSETDASSDRGYQNDESIWVEATFPANGKSNFTYKFAGRANYAYCLEATAIDDREQIINPGLANINDPGFVSHGDTYWRCFVPKASGSPTNPTDVCPNLPGNQATVPDGYTINATGNCVLPQKPTLPALVKPIVQLTGDLTVPTRVWANYTVETLLPSGVPYSQAVIPDFVTVTHFTPQSAYNGANGLGDSYNANYARYDSDFGLRLFMPFQEPIGGGQDAMIWEAALAQPAQLGIGGGSDGVLAQNSFGISWFRSTYANPCGASTLGLLVPPGTSAAAGASWPTEPNVCTPADASKPLLDAWDDSVAANVTYEDRYVDAASSTNALGWVVNQPLRCGGMHGSAIDVTSSACKPVHFANTNFSGPNYLNTVANAVRQAQGYVFIPVNSKTDASGNAVGAVGFELNTNMPGNVSGRQLWERDDGAQINTSTQPANYVNSITGQPGMWFCKTGLPASAKVAAGANRSKSPNINDPKNDRAVIKGEKTGVGETNDAACAGWAVGWVWEPTSTSYKTDGLNGPADACKISGTTPAPSSFPPPSDPAGSQLRAYIDAEHWGEYDAPVVYDNPSWAYLNGTVPYTGTRPGKGYGTQACSKSYPGLYHTGKWVQGQRFTHVVPPQTYTAWECIKWDESGFKCLQYGWVTYTTKSGYTYYTYAYNWQWNANSWQPTVNVPTNPELYANTHVTSPPSPPGDAEPGKVTYDSESGNQDESGVVTAGAWSVPGETVTSWSGPGAVGGQSASSSAGLKPQPGFGPNQTGPRLPADEGYVVDFTFSGLSSDTIASGWYSLTASYDGYTGWDWKSIEQTTPANSAATVAVYATRDGG